MMLWTALATGIAMCPIPTALEGLALGVPTVMRMAAVGIETSE